MASAGDGDPFLQVQADVETTLSQTRPLFSSYLRIRVLSPSANSPELLQSQSELLGALSNLTSDLSDLSESVNAAESDPYRFGLDVVEVSRRKNFVRDAGAEVESMRGEVDGTAGDALAAVRGRDAGAVGRSGKLPDPKSFRMAGDGEVGGGDDQDDDDTYAEFEQQQQLDMMHEQDQQMEGVSRTVGNLRSQAEDMGRELEEQGILLEETDTVAVRVEGKLQNGVRKVGHIIKKNQDTASSCCIGVLIFVLILLLVLVIVL